MSEPLNNEGIKRLLGDLRGEGEHVKCNRCGEVIPIELAIPEEGFEWECPPCNERCNAAEREELKSADGCAWIVPVLFGLIALWGWGVMSGILWLVRHTIG